MLNNFEQLLEIVKTVVPAAGGYDQTYLSQQFSPDNLAQVIEHFNQHQELPDATYFTTEWPQIAERFLLLYYILTLSQPNHCEIQSNLMQQTEIVLREIHVVYEHYKNVKLGLAFRLAKATGEEILNQHLPSIIHSVNRLIVNPETDCQLVLQAVLELFRGISALQNKYSWMIHGNGRAALEDVNKIRPLVANKLAQLINGIHVAEETILVNDSQASFVVSRSNRFLKMTHNISALFHCTENHKLLTLWQQLDRCKFNIISKTGFTEIVEEKAEACHIISEILDLFSQQARPARKHELTAWAEKMRAYQPTYNDLLKTPKEEDWIGLQQADTQVWETCHRQLLAVTGATFQFSGLKAALLSLVNYFKYLFNKSSYGKSLKINSRACTIFNHTSHLNRTLEHFIDSSGIMCQ